MAATSDGHMMKLYVDNGDGYRLEGQIDFTGALYKTDSIWTVGRGFYDNRPVDPFTGLIDEVRICDVALSPDHFLFAPPAKAKK